MGSADLAALRSALARELDCDVRRLDPVGGGCISAAYRATLGNGRRVFVKTHPRGGAMFGAEAHGLRWLAEGLRDAASELEVAEVLAVSEGEPSFLVLRDIEPGPPCPDHDERLGRGLAELHRSGAPSFGLERDNVIGSLPQDNRPCDSWPQFYWSRRLWPLVDRAVRNALLQASDVKGFEQLERRLPMLVGPAEPPARLHGDLWGGNVMTGERGQPVLIDPAVYGGHREVDLAMMRLFGGFSARCFAAYEEAWPLAPGARERVDLYQLYPLLVHVNLFGGGYVAQLRSALRGALR